MCGERQVMYFTGVADLQKIGRSTAARDVGLQNIRSVSVNESLRIIENIDILSDGDAKRGRHSFHQEAKTDEIVTGDGFFEPRAAELSKTVSLGERLFAAVRSVGIHEEFSAAFQGFLHQGNAMQRPFRDRGRSSSSRQKSLPRPTPSTGLQAACRYKK